MIRLSVELLAFFNEPALLIRGGRILYANAAACELLGKDCAEKSFGALFGADIAGIQAPSFVGEAELAGRRMLLNIRSMEGMRLVVLSPFTPVSEQVNEAFLHSLRSELMQIGVSASMLRARAESLDAEAAAASWTVTRSLFRINRTLQNLTVIRGTETGSILFRPRPTELCRLLRDLAGSIHALLPEPEICLELPDTAPISGDPMLLETLVLNLVSNCVQHAEGCTRIRILLHAALDQYVLSICDNGCGIPEDDMRTVMECYRREGALGDAAHGPGLGLTAVRSIARLHGGTLMMDSREGGGTSARVSLRREAPAFSQLSSGAQEQEKNYGSVLTGLAACLPASVFDVPFLEP